MENIRQEQEKKAEYLLERRRELEEERNADCTFTPSVTEGFQDIQRPVAVSGLDRFFELKTLALKKQQEQMEREQKVFRPESVAHQGLSVTVPEPFQLGKFADDLRQWGDAGGFRDFMVDPTKVDLLGYDVNSLAEGFPSTLATQQSKG